MIRAGKRTPSEGVAKTHALIEQIRSEQRAMFASMTASFEALRRDLRGDLAWVEKRAAALEAAVTQGSADIGLLERQVVQLSSEVRRLRRDFDSREETARIAALEARVTKLEELLKVG